MEKIIVRPAPDRRVRLETGELITAPIEVPRTQFYLRRLAAGDLELVAPEVAPATTRRARASEKE